MRHRAACSVVAVLLFTGCSTGGDEAAEESPTGDSTDSTTSPTSPPATGPDPSEEPETPDRLQSFDPDAVLSDVRRLANRIGTREATSPGFRRAARFVAKRFTRLGYDVRRVKVPVPAGDSWGVPVDVGSSYNVIAQPREFDATEAYRVVGAHLDTVAVSPGAEDNGSGTSVMLELARMAAARSPDVPVRFIAFGAEEPRGDSDDMHHFGSTQYVKTMSRAERRNLDAMVSLDRVGVRAPAVPICNAGPDGVSLRREVRRAARSAGVPSTPCEDRASDHWSFEKAGLPAIRLGSVPYAGYHSAQDRPRFVDERQARRVGRIMWRWLR